MDRVFKLGDDLVSRFAQHFARLESALRAGDDLRPAPDIGQDSYEVLLEAGFARGAIDDLVKAGAVRQAKGGAA